MALNYIDLNIELPSTTVQFGPLKFDVAEQLLGQPVAALFSPFMLRLAYHVQADPPRECYPVRLEDGTTVQLGPVAVHNAAGQLEVHANPNVATAVVSVLGEHIEGEPRVLSGGVVPLLVYTVSLDRLDHLEWKTKFGSVIVYRPI